MCIAYIAANAHPDWPLFIAANRDEYHARPSRQAAPWPDHPRVLAGRDEQAGGTWLGLTRCGRFALLTNYRDPGTQQPKAPSRGHLVSDFLTQEHAPRDYLDGLAAHAERYNGFTLIAGRLRAGQAQAAYLSNRGPVRHPQALSNGRHVLSNHLLNTPWPKAERLRGRLDALPVVDLPETINRSLEALRDNTPANDHELPDTGLDKEAERLLSSPFILSERYGTRCSSLIAVHRSGAVCFSETTYNAQGTAIARNDWPFTLPWV